MKREVGTLSRIAVCGSLLVFGFCLAACEPQCGGTVLVERTAVSVDDATGTYHVGILVTNDKPADVDVNHVGWVLEPQYEAEVIWPEGSSLEHEDTLEIDVAVTPPSEAGSYADLLKVAFSGVCTDSSDNSSSRPFSGSEFAEVRFHVE
jgi:hypothetical protein